MFNTKETFCGAFFPNPDVIVMQLINILWSCSKSELKRMDTCKTGQRILELLVNLLEKSGYYLLNMSQGQTTLQLYQHSNGWWPNHGFGEVNLLKSPGFCHFQAHVFDCLLYVLDPALKDEDKFWSGTVVSISWSLPWWFMWVILLFFTPCLLWLSW